MNLIEVHKGCGWKFDDGIKATIHSKATERTFLVELVIPDADHEYILPYNIGELRSYVNNRNIISVTFNNWLNEIPV